MVLSKEVPHALPEPGVATLGEFYASLEAVLSTAGYDDVGVFKAPGGFVLVTRIESIDSEGWPLAPPERWQVEDSPLTMLEALDDFFFPDGGLFRILVLVVTDAPKYQSNRRVKHYEARDWLEEGADELPDELAEKESSSSLKVVALVYDFQKVGGFRGVRQRRPGNGGLRAQDHLEKAGQQDDDGHFRSVWGELQR